MGHTHTHIHIHNTHDEFILSYQIYFINVPFEKKRTLRFEYHDVENRKLPSTLNLENTNVTRFLLLPFGFIKCQQKNQTANIFTTYPLTLTSATGSEFDFFQESKRKHLLPWS